MTFQTFRFATGVLLAYLSCATLATPPAHAALIQWKVADGGNGHLYEAILFDTPITWVGANTDAMSQGGELVSISSPEENAFVFGLIDAPEYWTLAGPHNYGPWIGGYQIDSNAEPAGNWAWTDGTPWSFTAWASGQPDNNGAAEHHAHYFVPSNTRAATWNDWTGGGLLIDGYVLEVIPEPGTLALASLCLIGVLHFRRTRRPALG
jgi:hypothetical protein